MPFHALITGQVLPLVLRLADEPPQPEDVKAGWTAFAVFIALGVAVALLGWSLVRQLKKAQAAQDAGVYDEATTGRPAGSPRETPADSTADLPADAPENHPQQPS